MRNKHFLAIVAAIAISISFAAPVTISATEVETGSDIIDDEQEDGEQTTIAAPDAETDTDTDTGSAGTSTGTSNGNTGSTGNTGTSSGASAAGSTKSSDSSLAHLGISPGSLTPAFSAGTHEYTTTVDANVTAISVAARPNHSKAVIAAVNGAKSLRPGTNTVKVIVEAENRSTTTYTITVICGSTSATTQQPADQPQNDPAEQPEDTQEQGVEGEISAIEEPKDDAGEAEVTFDDNGYLRYKGDAYMPASMMPEGDYVSLDKYNKLYEQLQTRKTTDTRILIVGIILLLLLLIVILNLTLKLRDVRQDVKLGLTEIDDEEEDPKKKRRQKEERVSKPAASAKPTAPAKPVASEKPAAPAKQERARTERPAKAEKPEAKPSKPAKIAKKPDEMEILDLNDL